MPRDLRLSVLLTLSLLVIGACGYTSKPLIAPQYRTVAVDIFDNQTNYRDFEFVLARALTNEITSRTHLRLTTKSQAETLLTGRITDFSQHVLTESNEDMTRELQVVIRLDFEWRDQRTGRVIRQVRDFSRSEQARFPLGETTETASRKVLQDVAQGVVDQLQESW